VAQRSSAFISLEKLIGLLNPAELAGTVIIVPLVNIPSFEQKVPHINPVRATRARSKPKMSARS
jgi:predicted deacylase